MGWMHDTLTYMQKEPIHRRYHHNDMTFSMVYHYDENFILSLSHDEVVHGKHSMLYKMPGDEWQQAANLRAYMGFMYAHPGKKLNFMGTEIAQSNEWNHDAQLPWHLLQYPKHGGQQRLIHDLNHLYRHEPALYQADYEQAASAGWITTTPTTASLPGCGPTSRGPIPLVVACNFTQCRGSPIASGCRRPVAMGGAQHRQRALLGQQL
jgi:1,4-alpha-glucan branching enzyme